MARGGTDGRDDLVAMAERAVGGGLDDVTGSVMSNWGGRR